jgi:hypothetical protein
MSVLPEQTPWNAKVMAALAIVFSFGACSQEDAPGRSEVPAVVCTSDAGRSPPVLRARGTLTRTKLQNELIYRLDLKEKTYEWRFITNVDKSITTMGPGFLIGDLVEHPKRKQPLPFPRGPINAADPDYPPFPAQSVHVNGEVRETLGAIRLWVTSGTKCSS